MSIAQNETVVLDKKTEQEIDLFLEAFYESGKTQEAGQQMVNSQLKTSQVRGLENLITATTRFSEIVNYIKNQTGKKKTEWQTVGPLLLDQLNDIEIKANEIRSISPALKMEIKLNLARGWARQVVAHYFYKAPIKGGHVDDE
ncbi:MAG: hypothetical protein ACOZF0_07190 [Thermodesulfobacteriota bacterium]